MILCDVKFLIKKMCIGNPKGYIFKPSDKAYHSAREQFYFGKKK